MKTTYILALLSIPFAIVFSFISVALSCFFISLTQQFFAVTTYAIKLTASLVTAYVEYGYEVAKFVGYKGADFAMIGLTFIGKSAFWSIAMLLIAIKFYIRTALKFAKNTRQTVSDFFNPLAIDYEKECERLVKTMLENDDFTITFDMSVVEKWNEYCAKNKYHNSMIHFTQNDNSDRFFIKGIDNLITFNDINSAQSPINYIELKRYLTA